MNVSENPYTECDKCRGLEDCKYIEVTDDGFSTPFPPDICPKINEVMAKAEKRRRKHGGDTVRNT